MGAFSRSFAQGFLPGFQQGADAGIKQILQNRQNQAEAEMRRSLMKEQHALDLERIRLQEGLETERLQAKYRLDAVQDAKEASSFFAMYDPIVMDAYFEGRTPNPKELTAEVKNNLVSLLPVKDKLTELFEAIHSGGKVFLGANASGGHEYYDPSISGQKSFREHAYAMFSHQMGAPRVYESEAAFQIENPHMTGRLKRGIDYYVQPDGRVVLPDKFAQYRMQFLRSGMTMGDLEGFVDRWIQRNVKESGPAPTAGGAGESSSFWGPWAATEGEREMATAGETSTRMPASAPASRPATRESVPQQMSVSEATRFIKDREELHGMLMIAMLTGFQDSSLIPLMEKYGDLIAPYLDQETMALYLHARMTGQAVPRQFKDALRPLIRELQERPDRPAASQPSRSSWFQGDYSLQGRFPPR